MSWTGCNEFSRLSRPFRARDYFGTHTQGIAPSRSALGWVLVAFQAMGYAMKSTVL